MIPLQLSGLRCQTCWWPSVALIDWTTAQRDRWRRLVCLRCATHCPVPL